MEKRASVPSPPLSHNPGSKGTLPIPRHIFTAALDPQPNDAVDSPNRTAPDSHSQPPEKIDSEDDNSFQPNQNAVESIAEAGILRDVQYGSIDLLKPWFPEVDPEDKRARTFRTQHSRQDVLLWTATGTSVFVFLVNLIATIVTAAKYKTSNGVAPLHEGSCSWVRNVDTILHVVINLLGSMLLGASNLCMQVLSAPTRKETDEAHKRKRWLDIGVPSWRNLTSIGRDRFMLWCFLGLTSVPLHFLYNSAVSMSIPAYGYAAAVVGENFLHGAHDVLPKELYPSKYSWPDVPYWDRYSALFNLSNAAFDSSKVRNLTTRECLKIYTDAYGDRTDMLMVTENDPKSTNLSLLQYTYQASTWRSTGIYWPCDNGSDAYKFDCDRLDRLDNTSLNHWTKFDRKVLYCISQKRTKEHCRLNYSPAIMIVVCCVSALKCSCIAFTARKSHQRPEPTLCVLGDAISSFLEHPDETTQSLGIATKASIEHNNGWSSGGPIPWRPSASKWYAAASYRRWVFTMFLCAVAVFTAIGQTVSGLHATMTKLRTTNSRLVLNLGFGTPKPTAFTAYFLSRYGTKGFIENVLFANYWQMIISLLYLAYNALLTCQLVAEEWSGYAKERKTLRVSHPKGIQRSSYFISMPLKYGIPLISANATLHWLVSQSIFLVSTSTYFSNDIEDTSNSYVTTGYSTSACLASVCFGVFMLLVFVLNSFRTLPDDMPLVSTCSAAISAACHRPNSDSEAHLLPVQWGVIPSESGEVSRCSFTTYRHVGPPEDGGLYLGIPTTYPTTLNRIQRLWRWPLKGIRWHGKRKK